LDQRKTASFLAGCQDSLLRGDIFEKTPEEKETQANSSFQEEKTSHAGDQKTKNTTGGAKKKKKKKSPVLV
jgi:hypothetical protein